MKNLSILLIIAIIFSFSVAFAEEADEPLLIATQEAVDEISGEVSEATNETSEVAEEAEEIVESSEIPSGEELSGEDDISTQLIENNEEIAEGKSSNPLGAIIAIVVIIALVGMVALVNKGK